VNERITIIGLGLMGGSLARDARTLKLFKEIVGMDPDNSTRALELGLVDRMGDLNSTVPESDLICLCVPVDVIEELLPKVLDLISDSAVVTDMGSIKQAICDSVRDHSKRSQYVAAHPMAGTEFSGPDAALNGLFRGKSVVICDRESSSEESLKRVEELYIALGMRVRDMESEQNDLHSAFISHLSHITSFVLANSVLEKEKDSETIFDLASGGFESTVRLAKSNSRMWDPIFRKNQKYVLRAIRTFERHLSDFRDAIADDDCTRLTRLMREANAINRVLSKIEQASQKRYKDKGKDKYHENLDTLRAEINELDEQLLRIVSTRLGLAEKVGRIKQKQGLKVKQPERWVRLMEARTRTAAKIGLDKKFITKVFDTIHQESIRIQEIDRSKK